MNKYNLTSIIKLCQSKAFITKIKRIDKSEIKISHFNILHSVSKHISYVYITGTRYQSTEYLAFKLFGNKE